MTFRRVGGKVIPVSPVAFVFLVFAVSLGVQTWKIQRLQSDLEEQTTGLDRLAGEATAERARANGWVSVFAEVAPHLSKELRKRDSILALTIRDLRISRAEITALERIEVSIEGTISSPGTPSAPLTEDPEEVPPSWEGEYDDGLLRGSWLFSRIPSPLLEVDYFATPEIELVHSVTGDGRTLVIARGLDPRVTPIFKELLVDPLPPEVRKETSVKNLVLAGIIGAGLTLLWNKE